MQTDAASFLKVSGKTELVNTLFKTGKSALLPKLRLEFNKLVKHMNSEPNLAIEISGYTDNVGKEASNLDLSKARAKAVIAYMVSKGIAAEKLSFKGYGSEQAVADNKTAVGRAQNRRVEVMVITK